MEIIFEDVYYQENNRYILKDINFTIKNKTVHALIGDVSKFIIPKLLLREYKITSGNIFMNSEKFTSENVVYSDNNKIYNENTIRKLIQKVINCEDNERRIYDAFKIVGLDDNVIDRDPNLLSLGEKTKLSIMLAIIKNPKIIILNEPSFALDSFDRKRMIALIKKMKNRYNKTIIIITNDLNFVIEVADYIAVFNKNVISVSNRKSSVIKDAKQLKKVGINLPLTIEFADRVFRKKQIKLGYRTSINDLLKDIYRHAEWGISKK